MSICAYVRGYTPIVNARNYPKAPIDEGSMGKPEGRLEGKIALITGGSSGIGLATAKRFVEEGAFVFITGRREAELDAAVKAIGKNVKAIKGDVSKLDDLDRIFSAIKNDKGRLDVVFDINVKGMLFTVQKALPLLPDGAAVILASSVVGSKGLGANSVYAATKAVARSFARTWTTDLKQRRIRVNAISPGSIDTPGLNGLLASSPMGEQRRKTIDAITPLGRLGRPDEIAAAAVFLASDEASYVAGAELFADGGFAQV